MYQYLIDTLNKKNMVIYDKTPVIKNNRPLEIKTWLDNHNNTSNYVILDDDFSKNEYKKYNLEKHLVHIQFFCKSLDNSGLQQKHVEQAIKIFMS